MPQFVYVASNPSMPGLIKIGKTCNVTDRLRSLSSSSSVPFPFELHYSAEIRDDLTHDEVELALHSAFRDCRVNEKREFFKLQPDRVIPLLELLSKPETVQDEDPQDYSNEMSQEFLDVLLPKNSKRFGSFKLSLSELEIPIGSILHFARDKQVTCTVVDEKNVNYNGHILPLGIATVEAWKLFDRHYSPGGGMKDWLYENERLRHRAQRYKRIQEDRSNES
jgi:hypothetical protein